jgi:radical SAM protein with 4Fe4S-binding SPASM domain
MAPDQKFFLSRSAEFTVTDGIPVLRHMGSGIAHRLQLGEAIALTFLAAEGRREVAADACAAEIDKGAQWVDHVIDRFWSYLGGDQKVPLDFTWLNAVDFDAVSVARASRRQAAPRALVWLVTLACHRRCPYCFYKVSPHRLGSGSDPEDATFTRSAVSRMLVQMGEAGASDLYLTGGEPLLRSDLVSILTEARDQRIRTHLSTKYPIDTTLARQLRDVGLHSITYSLDAGNSQLADRLAGSKGFFEEAVLSLTALSKVGLDPEVNAVLTCQNLDHLDELAQVLVDCGVMQLSISLYMPPPDKRPSAQTIGPNQDHATLTTIISETSERWASKLCIRVGDTGKNLNPKTDVDQPACDVGFSELHLLPDGSVTRCRYLPSEKTLIIGSLEQQSIMEIWHASPLRALNSPSPSAYATTLCASCEAFEDCNERGRCYVSALQKSGRLAGPDVFCPLGMNL